MPSTLRFRYPPVPLPISCLFNFHPLPIPSLRQLFWVVPGFKCRLYAAAGAVDAGQTLRLSLPDGSTFLHEIASWPPSWKYDVIIIYSAASIKRRPLFWSWRTFQQNFIPFLFETTSIGLWCSEEVRGRSKKNNKKNTCALLHYLVKTNARILSCPVCCMELSGAHLFSSSTRHHYWQITSLGRITSLRVHTWLPSAVEPKIHYTRFPVTPP